MRAGTCIAIAIAAIGAAWGPAPALAQDNTSVEQMKKMYDDALQQLKASQERKNQLAAENEKLKQQVDALNKELGTARGELQTLRQSDAGYAERTFFLRSHYMAWQAFAKANPETAVRWRVFLESTYLLTPDGGVRLIDRALPAPVEPSASQPAATQPVTQPATAQPAATQPVTTQPVTTQPAETPPTTAPATAPSAVPPATAPATQATTRPA